MSETIQDTHNGNWDSQKQVVEILENEFEKSMASQWWQGLCQTLG